MRRSFNSFYASSGMRANAFFPRGFGDPEDRRAHLRAASSRAVPPAVLSVLAEQQEAFPASESRRAHLHHLAEPGTAVVVTGQQVGLFLGPLYTVYKAASAVAIARALMLETGIRCVPLFWLQTEDHDFDEIAAAVSPGDGGELLRLQMVEQPGDARRSLADRVLGPEVTALVDQLEASLERLPFAAEVISLLRRHYRAGVSPGRAFAGVLAELFAEDGLLVFDPRHPVVARAAMPVLRTALTDAAKLDATLAERGKAFDAAGFAEQIQLRPGSPLAFFHLNGANGPRHRLVRRGERYTVPGSEESFSEAALLSLLEKEPLRFSTSALLRPIVQDSLLPTAAYVGGPAEVNYFAQVTALYSAFGMEPPLIAERAHFRLMTARVRSYLQKLGLSANELELPREALVQRLAQRDGSTPDQEWLQEFNARLDAYAPEADALDPALRRAVERTRGSIRHAFERLIRRHQRTLLQRDQTLSERLSYLDGWLRPEGAPQERVHSFSAFAARVGLAEFRRAIMAAVDPFNPTLREIDL